MRTAQLRTAASGPVGRGMLAGCGGRTRSRRPPAQGKVVSGETETGMKLKVDTFVPPRRDPRSSASTPSGPRATTPPSTTTGSRRTTRRAQVPDQVRDVTFAKDANAIATGQGVEARFACDVLRYEWPPLKRHGAGTTTELRKSSARTSPTKPDGIAPGARSGLLRDHRPRFRAARDRKHEGVRASQRGVRLRHVVRRGGRGGSTAAALVRVYGCGRARA